MGSLGFWRLAQAQPDWIAAVDPDGTEHAAGDLLARVNQLVHALRERGLRPGDGIAGLMPNGAGALEVYLAALQAGWYFTPVNWHYTAPEIAYIVRDCKARAFFADSRYAAQAAAAADEAQLPAAARFSHGEVPGFVPVTRLRAGQPESMPDHRTAGITMHYTSGTTGRPKGVRRALPPLDPDDTGELVTRSLQMIFGITAGRPNAHLVTSPNYHAAVTYFGGAALQMGHTLVFMDKWDPAETLANVERYRVTNSHMVPYHFKRMLALPADVRARHDLSSMKWLIHAAAPCPVPVKRAMLEWWGPCVYEYYAATEGGGTIATPHDWLAHPGTVGRPWPSSEVRVVTDDGRDCRPGSPGTIYMKAATSEFVYFGDPVKTAAGRMDGFFTVGDIGFFDEEGFLYLCDRKSDMIISGGTNIYPAEIEAELMVHPKVADVAVFGIPDEEWGEQIKAVVQAADGVPPGPDLAAELIGSLEGHLAKMKWPKSVDFIEEMPRDPSGKLRKRKLRDPYWEGHGSAI